MFSLFTSKPAKTSDFVTIYDDETAKTFFIRKDDITAVSHNHHGVTQVHGLCLDEPLTLVDEDQSWYHYLKNTLDS